MGSAVWEPIQALKKRRLGKNMIQVFGYTNFLSFPFPFTPIQLEHTNTGRLPLTYLAKPLTLYLTTLSSHSSRHHKLLPNFSKTLSASTMHTHLSTGPLKLLPTSAFSSTTSPSPTSLWDLPTPLSPCSIVLCLWRAVQGDWWWWRC